MADQPTGRPKLHEVEYWNSTATQTWADNHEQIDGIFAGLTEFALGLAEPKRGERVLDIGCASGTTVLELAARVGPDGSVLGADISQHSLARARLRLAASGLRNAEVTLAEVSTHAFAPESFDLAFSRFGVMFFVDPAAAFAHLRRAMKPRGRLTLVVFRTAQENSFATAPVAAVRHLLPNDPPPGPETPGQFSWADPARVRRILEAAGFTDVSLTPHDPAMRLAGPGGTAEAADFAMRFGPARRASLNMTASQQEHLRSALEAFFRSQEGPQGIVMAGAIWVVRARA